MSDWIYFLGFGALAGWIANWIMRGKGLGLIGKVLVGIAGAVIGTKIFDFFGISVNGGFIGTLIKAVAGSAILLTVLGFLKRRR